MSNGIGALIQVTQLKSQFANEEALHGADKQRGLVADQKAARERLRAFEDMVRDNTMTDDEYWRIGEMMDDVGADKTGKVDGSWDGLLGNDQGNGWEASFDDVENSNDARNKGLVDSIRGEFEDVLEDLESQDKLGNFEIQDLMSRFNQAETLASSVLKKQDDTKNAVIGKV